MKSTENISGNAPTLDLCELLQGLADSSALTDATDASISDLLVDLELLH